MRRAALLPILLACSGAARAADLCSNRPGLATTSCVLPAGIFQLESSLVDWSRSDDGGQLALGAAAARLGIGRATELQAAWTPWTRLRPNGRGGTISGAGDAQIAAKTLLVDGPVSIAASPFINIPLAKRALGSGTVDGGLIIPVDFTLPGRWGLTLSPEFDWTANADRSGRHVTTSTAASLGYDAGDRLSIALDVALARDFDPSGHSGSGVAGLSLAWLARPNLQLDIEADTRLYGDAADAELIAGFVYRP